MAKWRMTRLPKGWKVVQDEFSGFNFLDNNGEVVISHSKDTNSARHKVWEIYKKRLISKRT